MDESEENMSSEDLIKIENPSLNKVKPKKRSLVERELETKMTARVTSPVTNSDTGCTSRYGRARRIKTDADYIDTETGIKIMTSPIFNKTPVKTLPPVYKMHASNSPIKMEPIGTPKEAVATDTSLANQIENIYHENVSLSRFGSEEKKSKSPVKYPKVYVRKDLIQTREKEEYVMMIKNIFSPVKSSQKNNSHLNNIFERSSEKYSLNTSTGNLKSHNDCLSNSSVVKTLDFDSNKKKKKENRDGKVLLSKSDLFDMEAKCEYQVGDLAWARMGTFPFWPCIVTREPSSGMFVKKKLFGRIERDIVHVTFFGDNGRRGWIVETMLRRFLGQLEFESTRDTFDPSAKKKDPRLYAAFFVSEKKMPQWSISVEEAETLLREPKRLRIDILYDMLAKARSGKCTPKQRKSGKIARTASDVASDVSLSESLYDTLFSEDDGKTEDTERSRSKTRMSLDVSEVVTACLDNMAAKTGITKIQRQSHMDRWLQKAKSKTPEKSQANLPPQQKDKDVKVTNAKKKKKVSPLRVIVKKPYSFRKSSYEPQILKSHDNEHNYSTKIGNDKQSSDENHVPADIGSGLIAKVESVHDNAEDIEIYTIGNQTVNTNSEVLKKEHNDITLEDDKNTNGISPMDITEERLHEIQENICSVQENDELLLGHLDNLLEIPQMLDESNKNTLKPIESPMQTTNEPSIDTERKSAVIPNKDSNKAENHEGETSYDVTISSKGAKIPSTQETSIEVTQTKTNADNNIEIMIQVNDAPIPNMQKSVVTDHEKNILKAINVKALSDAKNNSAEFVKYLELRQDALMDEHPELSQDEIEDYLYKTWQYEESSKSDFKNIDDMKRNISVKSLKNKSKQKSVKKHLNENQKSKKSLSLKTNARKKNKDILPVQSLLSSLSGTRSLRNGLSNSSVSPTNTNAIKGTFSIEADETSNILSEHSCTEADPEMSQQVNEDIKKTAKQSKQDKEKVDSLQIEGSAHVRRSLRTKLSNSPAIVIESNNTIGSRSKEGMTSNAIESGQVVMEHCHTREDSKMTQNVNELNMDTAKIDENNMNKEKINTTPIAATSSVRRSLRSRLSNFPAVSIDSNEITSSVGKEITQSKVAENTQIVTGCCESDEHSEIKQNINEVEVITPKLPECNRDTENHEASQIYISTSGSKSLKSKLPKSPAVIINTNEIIKFLSKETTAKMIKSETEILMERCNIEENSNMTPNLKEVEVHTLKLDENYIENVKIQETPIMGSVRRSLRSKLSVSPSISIDTNKVIKNESITLTVVENSKIVTECCNTEENTKMLQNIPELKVDKPSDCKKEEKESDTTKSDIPIMGANSVRKSLRSKLSKFPAVVMDTNNIVSCVTTEKSAANSMGSPQILTERCNTEENSETRKKTNEIEVVTLGESENNVKKEIKEILQIESDTLKIKPVLGATSVRKSLRSKLSKYPTIAIDKNQVISRAGKESFAKIENSYKAEHSEMTQNLTELEVDTTKLTEFNIDKPKNETLQNGSRPLSKFSEYPAVSADTDKTVSSVDKESSTVNAIGSTHVATDRFNAEEHYSNITQNVTELGVDTSTLSECNMNKENVTVHMESDTAKTIPILDSASVRKSFRSKLSNSPAISMDSNNISSVIKNSRGVKAIGSTQTITERGNKDEHYKLRTANKLLQEPPKLSAHEINTDKMDTTLILGATSVRKSRRSKLSLSPATSINANVVINSIGKDNVLKIVENTQDLTGICNTVDNSEVTHNANELQLETPKLSVYKKEDEKVDTSPIVCSASVRRSLRTRISQSPAMSLDTKEIISFDKDINTVNTNENIATVKHLENHFEKRPEHVMDTLITGKYNIEKCDIDVIPAVNLVEQTELIHVADEASVGRENQVNTTLVTSEQVSNDIVKVTDDPITDTIPVAQLAVEHNISTELREANDTHSEVFNIATKTPIESWTSRKKSDGFIAFPEKTVNIIMEPSSSSPKQSIDAMQSINGYGIDVFNKSDKIKQTHAEDPTIHTEKQAKISNILDEHTIENDQALDTSRIEDKEYGHLDFVFSSLNEKLITTICDSAIVNDNNVSLKNISREDFKKAVIPKDKTLFDKNNTNLKNNIEETDIVNLDNKYKNLYNSCTKLQIRVERLPCLSQKIINIKDLDNEMELSKARRNGAVNNIELNDKQRELTSKITPEDSIGNENNKATHNVHETEYCSITKDTEIDVDNKSNFDDKSNGNIVIEKRLEKVEDKITKKNLTNDVKAKINNEKVVSNKMSDVNLSSDKPVFKQTDSNMSHMNTPAMEDLLLDDDNTKHNQNKVQIKPVVIIKSETDECVRIQPVLINGFQYIYDDDDEDEFESPAFSPIFKEPIKKEKEIEDNNDLEAATDNKNTITAGNHGSKYVSTELPLSEEQASSTKNNNKDILTSNNISSIEKQNDSAVSNEDELMDSVSLLPEPVKINGFLTDEYGLDFSDNGLNVETSSINSEDSEPLAVTKSKLVGNKKKNVKKALQDVEFVKYLELRQDGVMDEHPELNQDEIVDYLYKTWQYEENSKSDLIKNDDIEQAGLVKGLNDNLRQKSIRNSYRDNKKKNKKRDGDTQSINTNISKKRNIQDEDTVSINSDVSDTSVKRRLRTRLSNSPAISMDENEFCMSKESSPERKPNLEDSVSIDSEDVKITKRKVRNQILDDSLEDDDESFFDLKVESKSRDKSPDKIGKTEEIRQKKTLEKRKNKSPKSCNNPKIDKYFTVLNTSIEIKTELINEHNIIDANKKIKEEYGPDTVSIASVNSEDSEVSISKRKQRKNAEKQTTKSRDDPEFLKYLELRQDDLTDENPQLTHEEIVAYLYKTWLYEENAKSDLKKSDEIEQANLVKGLNSEVQPKKVRKKIKIEKDAVNDEVPAKEKPKRKISQPFYYDVISDIEDEIELFEIFKPKTKPIEIKSENCNGEVKKANEIRSNDGVVKTEVEEILIQDEIDEVELYFAQLPQPKPNVFKGLVREKVCEICEKTGNLVKCKGCSSMFHVDCDKKVIKESVVASTKGRKKKKKPGRKPKNYEDSESHSDEKSQDVSEEFNASIEEIEAAPRVVDEDVLEAALTAKMQELFPTIDLTYDSYSSDDGLDWDSAPPGHCEIVDVKVKPKAVVDYADFKCKNCQMYSTPVCFVCKQAVSKTNVSHRQKCQTNHCNKYYHLECLDHWPQTQFNSGELSKNIKKINERTETLMCPRHVCHTCVSDDPRGCKTRFSGDKLARCVKCPATYHSFTKCLPAGTQILTGSLIVCPRHYEHRAGKVPCHVNTGWCFICALGGSLICCEYCPTSFHAECLNIKPPEGGYMCEDCETGRLPLYGEMVWVKLGHYRWWPGIILHPSEIPENIMAVKHHPGEFVVRFFGQYDHYWVNRGRVFPFQEGDSGRISTQKSKIDAAFIMAMEHAHRAFEILKAAKPNDEESIDIASSLLPPHYVKLKVNKPCGSLIGRRPDIEESSLTQCECDPYVEDPCGPYSHCLNRMLLTECGPICRAGDRCNNRAFEKRLYPKMVPYRTPHRGWGLKTLEDIRAGQFVIEYVGELLDEEEFRRRMDRMHEIRDENFYFLTLDKERMIDAGPKGNLARFMNHCCEPNCETQKWTVLGDVRVGLFAMYDIPANSELTFNYNLECTGIEKKQCLCGARRCSGYIGAKPKQEETQPKKKRAYKKRAKPVEESPSTSKNKPKRPVGRPAKPRELTEIEKDLIIIKNATSAISSDSETSSRLGSIDNPNPKALKRKRVSFSAEESLPSSPSTKRGNGEDSSPCTKKANIEDSSPSTKKDILDICSPGANQSKTDESMSNAKRARVEDSSPSNKKDKLDNSSPSTKKAKLDDSLPIAKRAKIEEGSPSTKKAKIENSSPSTRKAKTENISPSTKKSKTDDSSPSTKKSKVEDNISLKKAKVDSSPGTKQANTDDSSPIANKASISSPSTNVPSSKKATIQDSSSGTKKANIGDNTSTAEIEETVTNSSSVNEMEIEKVS